MTTHKVLFAKSPIMSKYTLYIAHNSYVVGHSIQVYTVHCTLYTVHCTLYTVHCTLYTLLYTVIVVVLRPTDKDRLDTPLL